MIVLAALCAALAVGLGAETVAGRPLRWPRPTGRRGPAGRGGRLSRQVWLSQAGAAVTPAQFWAVSAGLAAVAFVVLFAVDRAAVVAVVPAVGVGAVPYGYWAAQRRRGRTPGWRRGRTVYGT